MLQLRTGPKAGRLIVTLDFADNGQRTAYPIWAELARWWAFTDQHDRQRGGRLGTG